MGKDARPVSVRLYDCNLVKVVGWSLCSFGRCQKGGEFSVAKLLRVPCNGYSVLTSVLALPILIDASFHFISRIRCMWPNTPIDAGRAY